MKLVATPGFARAYRKLVRRRPALRDSIDDALLAMSSQVNAPKLHTHKLSGQLAGLFACSCGYDCRIVFSIQEDAGTCEQVILLVDIGTHQEVY
jgi:mRNA interferase YafQ